LVVTLSCTWQLQVNVLVLLLSGETLVPEGLYTVGLASVISSR